VIHRTACLSVAAGLLALLTCAAASAHPAGIEAARAFHRYPVYWAGEDASEMPLESIEDYSAFEKNAPSGWSFGYGSCKLEGTDHPSCPLPLQIQVSSTCTRWAGLLDHQKGLFDFRGAKAHWFAGIKVKGLAGLQEAGPLEIFTGRVTVVIYAQEKKIAFATARALRTVHQTKPAALPPPVPGSLTGNLPCQGDPHKEPEPQ
jgi:hypothetical protein